MVSDGIWMQNIDHQEELRKEVNCGKDKVLLEKNEETMDSESDEG